VFLLFYFAKQWLKLLIIEKQEVLDENLEDPGVDSKDDQIPSHSETRYRLLIPIHKVYGVHSSYNPFYLCYGSECTTTQFD
jgi:hypothetical protein